jgi:hypothetical protein
MSIGFPLSKSALSDAIVLITLGHANPGSSLTLQNRWLVVINLQDIRSTHIEASPVDRQSQTVCI